MGREFGAALVQLLRKRSPREVGAEPLVLTLVPGLFPTLCSITPASWVEAAAPSKMSHQL